MIVRILGEGQFDVADDRIDTLNELDDAVEAAIAADDEAAFTTAFAALLEAVRVSAAPHAADALDASDLVLPPADASMGEVREMLAEDGLIPG
ncbi:hypothetical protein [Nocardioides sp. CFH 31398]|uniref:PspA-associated protein PspAA n=1 Tax=Nocardioides sp. CFH 31398 TaxID=2919579 RepID=UPI001F058064|nr:hypothetical protein [Nocardioides sp. CFH 31398]MCH1868187.1 hypothetical protein [Nocardioides sp. CFH 31398]